MTGLGIGFATTGLILLALAPVNAAFVFIATGCLVAYVGVRAAIAVHRAVGRARQIRAGITAVERYLTVHANLRDGGPDR